MPSSGESDENRRSSSSKRRKDKKKRDDEKEDSNGGGDDKADVADSAKQDDRSTEKRRKHRDRKRGRSSRRSKRDASESDDGSNGSDDDESASEDSRRHRRKKSKSKRKKKHKKSSSRRDKRKRSKKRRKRESSSSESSDSESSSSDDSSSDDSSGDDDQKVVNKKLMAKLEARGETLEERRERRAQRRAAKITSRFGYTADENPFNDPNLHETFAWGKKAKADAANAQENVDTLDQIENIRARREERFRERDEMERLRAEESRMKELEHYDDWAKKEEAFHLNQQRQRSAIRLVEGRQKPIDVLAKNLLLFGLANGDEENQAKVKYQEKNNPLTEMQDLQAELEEPASIVGMLKLAELKELLSDIEAFRALERDAGSSSVSEAAVTYWDSLHVAVSNEIKLLQNGGTKGAYGKKMAEIGTLFKGQSQPALVKMKNEVESRLSRMVGSSDSGGDRSYWRDVREQLIVHLAKMTLSDIHSKMLVRQLERLEQKRDSMKRESKSSSEKKERTKSSSREGLPEGVSAEFGNEEEEMGEGDEIVQATKKKPYPWERKYKARKPRYFNRVKTGYDWNKYNQTHYDHDNPPPKIVQGYKFNIFYPELADPTKTPQYFIEPADSNEFCIIRFHGGPPYEDVAFKIINKEWNRSRKRGFKSSFERGVLSLYVNFKTHWYRR